MRVGQSSFIQRGLLSQWLVVGLLVLFAASHVKQLSTNLLYRAFYAEIWQTDRPATQRQASLQNIVDAQEINLFLEPSNSTAGISDSTPSVSQYNMIASMYLAERYRRLDETGTMIEWIERAATAPAFPDRQKAIQLSPLVMISNEGNLEIPNNTSTWQIRADTVVPAEIRFDAQDGAGVFVSTALSSEQRRAAFEWNDSTPIPYHHQGMLQAQVDPLCTLMLETSTELGLVRHIVHNGTGQWQDLPFTIEGDLLKHIYLLLEKSAESTEFGQCEAKIRSISLGIDS